MKKKLCCIKWHTNSGRFLWPGHGWLCHKTTLHLVPWLARTDTPHRVEFHTAPEGAGNFCGWFWGCKQRWVFLEDASFKHGMLGKSLKRHDQMERMVKKDPKRYGLYHVGRCMYYIKGADHIDNNIVCIYICHHDASCIIYIYFSQKTSDFRCFLSYTTKFWGLSGTSHGFSFSESPTGPTVFHHGGLAPTTQGSGEALFQALATSCTIAPVHWTHLSTEIYVSTAKILVYAVSLRLRNPDPSLSLFWPLYYLLNLCIYCMHIFLTRVFLSFLSPNFAASNSASHPPAMCSSRLTEHCLSPGHITKPNITLAQVTTNLQYLILPVWVWLGFARIAGTEIHPKGHISWGIFLLLITFRKGPAKMCIYKWMFPWQQKQHVLPHKAYPYSKS